MSLSFPNGVQVGYIHDPGNGIRYVWDGDYWNEVDTELLTTLPLEVDKDVDDKITFNIDLTQLTNI